MPEWVGILIAFVSTAIMNFGLALQKRGAISLPRIGEAKALEAAKAFFTNWTWLTGLAGLVAGWGLYLVATNIARISLVQPALGSGLLVLAVFSIFYLHERIKAIEWASLFCMIAGMLLLGLSATEEAPKDLPQWSPLLIVTGIILVLSIIAYILGKRGMLAGFRTDSLLGIVCGLFIGLAALFTRSMMLFAEADKDLIAFGICLPVMLASNIIGMIIMQSGFQHGKALVVVGLEAVINKIVAIVGGMVALSEALPKEPAQAAMQVAAFVLILFATAFLSRFGGEEIAKELAEKAEEEQK
jgi:drug/metabolite transporter (DMT)-like permease